MGLKNGSVNLFALADVIMAYAPRYLEVYPNPDINPSDAIRYQELSLLEW
jgi:hypothetical protein